LFIFSETPCIAAACALDTLEENASSCLRDCQHLCWPLYSGTFRCAIQPRLLRVQHRAFHTSEG